MDILADKIEDREYNIQWVDFKVYKML